MAARVTAAHALHAGRRGMARILVVEESAVAREALRELLGGEGHAVQLAATTAEAESMIASQVPDLVLTEAHAPGIDGLGLARRLRAQAPAPAVLIMSVFRPAEVPPEAFLEKPIDLERLAALIGRALV